MSQCPSPHEHNRDMILLHESTQNVLKTHALVSNAIPTRPRARNQMDADSCSQNNEMKSHLTISSTATHMVPRRDAKSEMPSVRSPEFTGLFVCYALNCLTDKFSLNLQYGNIKN